MKLLIKNTLTLFITACLAFPIMAQDVEVKLNTDDSTSAFTIKDVSDNHLFSVKGNGTTHVGNYIPNYFFSVISPVLSPYQTGQSILLQAEISAGATTATGAAIQILGGKGTEGGSITLNTGFADKLGGDVLITTGDAVDNGGSGGNVKIKTGGSITSSGSVTIECGGDYPGQSVGGSVLIIAGDGLNNGGNIDFTSGNGDSQNGNINLNTDGLVVVNGSGTYSGTWTQASDERYKKDIESLDREIDNVLKLNPVRYNWKKEEYPNKNFSDEKSIGLIGQEVEQIYPEIVKTDSDGYKSIDYSKLSVILLSAIKEQQKEIEELKRLVKK
jgi:hypothetical protein